jgi:MinD superfamily P-loop ATPase
MTTRLRQVAIVSGKGGTGKTTVAASFSVLAGPAVTADCDVDAANMALLLPGADGPRHPFLAGQRAEVLAEACNGCASCVTHCRFDAVVLDEDAATIDPLACEGCGVCRIVCPEDAIAMHPNQAGVWIVRETENGPLVHARLGVAQDNSGKLVAKVREVAREEAATRELDLVLIDGPPGIGCPVHAAVTGVDLLLAVTEPTPSGIHDLERLLQLAGTFRLHVAVLVNKADLSTDYTRRIRGLAKRHEAQVVGHLPFDPQVPRLLARGQMPLSLPAFEAELGETWNQIQALLLETRAQRQEANMDQSSRPAPWQSGR